MKFICGQKGCRFEADEMPTFCKVCNHPFIPHPDQIIYLTFIDDNKEKKEKDIENVSK